VNQSVFELGVPVLGICYGMQTMATQLGGAVASAESLGKAREFGYSEVRAHGHTNLLKGIQDFSTSEGHGILKVWMSHGDSVTAMPPSLAMAIAKRPSVTVSIAADTKGVLSEISRVNLLAKLASRGSTEE
jgi:GMP synthase (glutamine-hydrolysing)